MGTTYGFVCETCKKRYDVCKDYNALLIVPKLIELHKEHDVLIYSEHDDDLIEKYEGDAWAIPPKPSEYEYVEIWDGGTLKEDVLALSGDEWTPEQFHEFRIVKKNI